MKRLPRWWIVGCVGIFCVAVLVLASLVLASRHTIAIHVGPTAIAATLARTRTELIQGLSGTTNLPDSQGMLFVFPYASRWTMWMKDMRYPIDIMWLDSHKQIIDQTLNLSPATYPTSFTPARPALYALELPAGFSGRYNLLVGQYASFGL